MQVDNRNMTEEQALMTAMLERLLCECRVFRSLTLPSFIMVRRSKHFLRMLPIGLSQHP
jgi:hypothetical protein